MLEFPPKFFEEETRCDFTISPMMKRAWASQMEILQIVIDICEKNGLQYFADGGTLLGAVRHQGFIPWDDDIDIALKRSEYKELVRILPEQLPQGIKLGGIYEKPKDSVSVFPGFHSRVKSDGAEWELKEHIKRFHGCPYLGTGIDIFCYDYVPRDKEMEEVWNLILEYGMVLLGANYDSISYDEKEYRLQKMEELCGVTISRAGNVKWNLQQLLDSVAAICREEESDKMVYAFSVYKRKRGRELYVRKECFDKVIYLPFEHIKIAVPCGWHEMLVANYGEDYMTSSLGKSMKK